MTVHTPAEKDKAFMETVLKHLDAEDGDATPLLELMVGRLPDIWTGAPAGFRSLSKIHEDMARRRLCEGELGPKDLLGNKWMFDEGMFIIGLDRPARDFLTSLCKPGESFADALKALAATHQK